MRPASLVVGGVVGVVVGVVAVIAALALLTGCGSPARTTFVGSSSASSSPTPSATASPAATTSGTSGASGSASPAAAAPAPPPQSGACYNLTFNQALAPATVSRPVPCTRPHTTETYAVGRLQTVVDGHQLALDSARVRAQITAACPKQLGRFLGGSADAVRLAMLRAVWFTPTPDQSDAGAVWYRCDAVAIAGPDRLARVTGTLKGALGKAATKDAYAMCGTAAPDAAGFARVPCRAKHTWRAIATVPIPAGPYPGEAKAKAAGQTPCHDAGQSAATDALDFKWSYEWPTKQEWAAGQTYGVCWAPDQG